MSKFTDRLWRDIVREHGADLRGVERPAARPHHRLTRVLAGTGLAGVAGAGATLALVLGAASTTPAFAVTRNHDGTYSVGIRAFSAIPAANARLRALGLRARLVGVESGCSTATAQVLPRRVVVLAPARAAALAAGARFNPAAIPQGRMLVLPAVHYGNVVRLAPAKAVPGVVPDCLPTPAQVCMAGPAGGSIPGGPLKSTTGTTTDPTTTTATATSPTTASATSAGTTTTGTATAPGKPGQVPLPRGVIMRCFAPPPVFCRIDGSGAAGTGTSTTGTATTGTATTATTTTGTATTGTTTTGTTTGPIATPVPGQRLTVQACAGPPPPCFAKAGVTGPAGVPPAQIAAVRAKIAAIRARLAQIRPSQASGTATTGTSTGTATTGTGTTTGPVTAPLPPRTVRVMPVPFGAPGVICGPVGATGLTGVKLAPNSFGPAFAVPKPAVAKASAVPRQANDRAGARHTTRQRSRHASRRGTRHNRSR